MCFLEIVNVSCLFVMKKKKIENMHIAWHCLHVYICTHKVEHCEGFR